MGQPWYAAVMLGVFTGEIIGATRGSRILLDLPVLHAVLQNIPMSR